MRLYGLLAALLVVFGPMPLAQPTPGTGAQNQARPSRIISLVPAVTEMLFAVGAGNEVVGVSSYDTFPQEATTRPRVGALVDPDFEKILTLRPDLVVVYGTQGDLITRLERVRIPMFSYQHAGLADITQTIRELGDRIGRRTEGRRVADGIEAEVGAVRQRVAGRARPRTALLFGREPGTLRDIYASGGIGFLHDMLLAAGGENVFADIRRQSVQATTEMLLARTPEVILELRGSADWSAERTARERAVWRGLPSLPAVRNNRLYLVADPALLVPGPRVARSIALMADALHPTERPRR
jgi:iron complex transport system substrate-binding protein